MIKLATDIVTNSLTKTLIKKLKSRRLEYFFEQFTQAYFTELTSGIESSELDEIHRKIGNDPKSEELFGEIYRKVCLSSSRTIGPKLMGILAAKIFKEDRQATCAEMRIFDIAESLNDNELRDIIVLFQSVRWLSGEMHGKIPSIRTTLMLDGSKQTSTIELSILNHKLRDIYEIELGGYSIIDNCAQKSDTSTPSLEGCLGRWAVKLRNLDILLEKSSVHSQNHSENQMKNNYLFSVQMNKSLFDELIPLIDRATGPNLID